MCNCENKYNKNPDEYCLYCAEKHLATAMQAYNEIGYLNNNRQFIIGQLELARKHLSENKELSQKIRQLRHKIQDRQIKKIDTEWYQICSIINKQIDNENKLADSEKKQIDNKKGNIGLGKIYIFSNVIEEEKNKIETRPNDILVFLNKAVNYHHYENNYGIKINYRRSKDELYGKHIEGILNDRYVFDDSKQGMKKQFIEQLKNNYDWNYEVSDGNEKCMSTEYIVAEYMHHNFRFKEIILVNFDYEILSNENYNYKFEQEQLKKYKHIYTIKTEKNSLII